MTQKMKIINVLKVAQYDAHAEYFGNGFTAKINLKEKLLNGSVVTSHDSLPATRTFYIGKPSHDTYFCYVHVSTLKKATVYLGTESYEMDYGKLRHDISHYKTQYITTKCRNILFDFLKIQLQYSIAEQREITLKQKAAEKKMIEIQSKVTHKKEIRQDLERDVKYWSVVGQNCQDMLNSIPKYRIKQRTHWKKLLKESQEKYDTCRKRVQDFDTRYEEKAQQTCVYYTSDPFIQQHGVVA